MKIIEIISEASIASVKPSNGVSPEEAVKSYSKLSEVELSQLGTDNFISRELWPVFREFLLNRSLASNSGLDPELTAYTPGETLKLLSHPTISKWHNEVINYKIPPEYKICAFVPCAKTKPWLNANKGIYKSYNKIINDGKYPVYFVTISEPLGVVPFSLWNDFPQYDNPGLFKDNVMRTGGLFTRDWLRLFGTKQQKVPFDTDAYNECIGILSGIISKFISNNSHVKFLSFVEDPGIPISAKNVGTHSDMLNRSGLVNPQHRYAKREKARAEPYDYVDNVLSTHHGDREEDMKLRELIEPRKPTQTKSSVVSKFGVQGATTKIPQRRFITKLGNDIKVQFKPNGEQSVDVTFYVNDSLDDNAVKGGKDNEILPGVLFIILQYLKKSKVNFCSFEAVTGSGDYKTKYNLPKERIINEVRAAAEQFISKLENTVITPEMEEEELRRINAIYTRVNKPLATSAIVIHKEELLDALGKLINNVDNVQLDEISDIIRHINNYNKNIDGWSEYNDLMKLLYSYRQIVQSYTPGGTTINRNRRLDLYTKMVEKYLSNDWDIEIHGTKFYLTRKSK